VNRIKRDHRNARIVEDAVPQVHHLHRRSMAPSDLSGQIVSEDGHIFAIGRANVRRKFCLSTVTSLGRKEEQLGKLGCRQPREPAAIINPSESEAPVTFEAVPPEIGDVESFTAHRLNGIAEERLHASDFYGHARSGSRSIGQRERRRSMRASRLDVAKLRLVWQSQLADEAVAPNREVPHSIRY
jgi:hypothetical protein